MLDANTPALEEILADLSNSPDGSLRVHVLDAARAGIEQLDDIISSYAQIDSLHLFSHGSDGVLQLGASEVALKDLLAQASTLTDWREHLTNDADILLYGCDLAGNDTGVNFINTLATLTGADVAASNDKTGSALLGGDWELEASTGSIEAELAVSKSLRATYSSVLATFDVTNLNDSGVGSLRQAIIDANNVSGSHTITFSVAGTINVNSALPTLTETINIDATTAPGYSGTPVVVIDGSGQGSSDGIRIGIAADGSEVRGLAIINMPDDGISISSGADNITVQGNWIGTSSPGATNEGNDGTGIDVRGDNVQIGGTGANEGNVVVNSGSRGIFVNGDDAVIEGNYIGVDPDGVTSQGNALAGVYLSQISNTMVGGTTANAANTIAFNGGDGVEINGALADDNSVIGNAIFDNGQIGIDLIGTSSNDNQDIDFGIANDGQNFPVISSVEAQSTATRVVGTINTNPLTTVRIDFYAASSANNADRHLGFTTVTTDGSGDAAFDVSLASLTVGGEFVTAVATVDQGGGNFGASSQFSASQTVTAHAPTAVDDGLVYADSVLGLSPLSYWRFGETSGAVIDEGSLANNGTRNGPGTGLTGAIAGDSNTAYSFDGSNDYVEVAHNPAYNLAEGSFQLWFNADDLSSERTLFSKDANGNSDGHFEVRLDSGQVEFRAQTDSTTTTVGGGPLLSTGTWYHLVVSFDSSGVRIYLDGVEIINSSGHTIGLQGNSEPLAVGMSTQGSSSGSVLPGSREFDGRIDEFAIFSQALTEDQASSLYNAGLNGGYEVTEGGTLVVGAANGVLANDSDPQGDTLTATLISGPSYDASFTLNSDGSFTYNHDGSEAATDTFVYEVDDGNGNTDQATVTITINPVNDDPIVTSSANFFSAENQTLVGTVTSSDPDGGTPQYTLIGSDDDAQFNIDINTGALSFNTAPNFEAPVDGDTDNNYQLTVRVEDGNGGFATQSVTVSVTDVDEFDIGSISDSDVGANEVSEGASTGATVGVTAFADDADATDSITYTLDDSAGGLFTIDGSTGIVTLNGTLDRETATSHGIVVRATSTDLSFTTQGYTITVLDVNDTPPVITPAQVFDIDEDASVNDSVGSVVATDADTTGTLSGWAITAGNSDGVFAINSSTGEITIADTTNLNHEVADQYTLTIEVSDGVATVNETVTIDINDVNEAPTFTSTAITSATEDVFYSYLITANDVDDGDTPSFSAITLPAWLTLVDNGDGTATLSGTPTNSEVGGHSVDIQISDGSLTANQAFTVTVVNVNDDPVFTSSNTFSIAENQTAVGTVTSSDVDGGAPQYTLVGSDDDSLFSIDINTGALTFDAAPNFEAPADGDTDNDYQITVQVDDGAGGVVTQNITVTVTNVDEFDVGAISDTNVGANEVSEGASAGATVGLTAFADDADSPDTIGYTLDNDAGGLFTIDGVTGVVTLAGALDRETATSHNIVVRATSTDTSFNTQLFTITVLDVNDTPPVITPGQLFDIDEDASVSESVGTVAATDADTTGTLSGWTITAGNGDGIFAINASTGEITIAATTNLNHEAADQYTLTVEVSDGVATVSETVTVDINDINEAPTFTSAPITAATEDVLYSYTITADDVDDGDTPSFSAITLPAWLTLVDNGNGTATLSGTPTNSEVGGHGIDIQISDGSLTANQAFTLTVANVNDDPVITSPSTFSITENLIAVGTVTSSDVDGGAPQYTLVGVDDDSLFSIDINTGALTFNASPDFEAPADGDTDNDYEITVQVDDGAGGIVTQGLTVTVQDTNDNAPIISASQVFSVSESASNSDIVGAVLATDADGVGSLQNWLITAGNADGVFQIDPSTGIVSIADNSNLDFSTTNEYTLTLTVEDGVNTSVSQTVTVNVLSSASSPVAIDDGGDYVSLLSSYSPLSYWRLGEPSGTSVADSGSLANSGTINGATLGAAGAIAGESDTGAQFDGVDDYIEIAHDSAYELAAGTVQLWFNQDDDTGAQSLISKDASGTSDGHFDVRISDGDLILRLQTDTGQIQLTADDAVSQNEWYHLAVSFDSGGARLYLNGELVLSTTGHTIGLSDNPEPWAIGMSTISSAAGSVLPGTRHFSGTIDEVAILSQALDANQVRDLYGAGSSDYVITEGGTLVVNAADGVLGNDFDPQDDPLTATLISSTAAGLSLNADGSFTFNHDGSENATESFVYEISDGNGNFAQATATITVLAVNDDPVFTSSNTFSIAENQTAVGTVTSSDVDGGAPQYTLVGGDDDGLFNIDINTGALTFDSAPNFEAPADGDTDNDYEITVQVDDGAGGVVTQNITVTVTNVDEFDVSTISDTNAGANEVSEGASIGATVGITAFADDADSPDTVSYTLDDSAGGRFAVDGLTGVVTVNGALDREAAATHDITVRATSTDGSFQTQTFTITLLDVNDNTPVISADQTFVVSGNASIGTSVGTATASDPDTSGFLQNWTIVSGNADGIFAIDSLSGEVTVVDPTNLEFATTSTYDLVLSVADGVATSSSESVRILVTNPSESPFAADDGMDYVAAITGQSPLGYWRLGETSGSSAIDLGSVGNNGTYVGATLGTAGVVVEDGDTAASFDGSDDHVVVDDQAAYQITNGTIQAWIKPDSVGGIQTFIAKDSTTNGAGDFRFLSEQWPPQRRVRDRVGTATGRVLERSRRPQRMEPRCRNLRQQRFAALPERSADRDKLGFYRRPHR